MPLFRRNTNKESKEEAGPTTKNSHDTKTSLLGRISRRRSSSAGSGTAADHLCEHHDVEPSAAEKQTSSKTGTNTGTNTEEQESASSGFINSSTGNPDPTSKHRHHRDSIDQPDGKRRHSHHRHSSSHDRKPSSKERSRSRPDTQSTTKSGSADEPAHVEGGLSREDVQHLFYGAPHFMIEKGRRGRYFPQTFFPWNTNLEISDLQDRLYLKHESFALSTLHAHLPIPDEVNWKPGMDHPVQNESPETAKRPMFDLGIYERPNMLGLAGREPGTIGFRFYLEAPVSDGVVDNNEKSSIKPIDVQNVSALEALEVLSHEEGDAKIGKHAPLQDRVALAREGFKSWKRVGVRHISTKTITERLQRICLMRDEVVEAGWKATILDKVSADDLSRHLFGELLYPPSKLANRHTDYDLKIQIEALVKVLTTPGAWLDFSLPKERLLFGHVLNDRDYDQQDSRGIKQGFKRKWALVQLLLAIELVIRLDAALRLGVAQHNPELEITSEEIHHFNRLRNLKVDWDLVVARRFLDLCYVRKLSDMTGLEQQSSHEHKQSEHHFLDRFKRSVAMDETECTESDCAILPRQPRVMVEGLVRFADQIGWPNIREIEKTLHAKLCTGDRDQILAKGIATIDHPHIGHSMLESSSVELRAASEDTVGGPLSHTWFSSLVVPGYTSCDLLMATLLENDPAAISKLGPVAHIRAGFVLDGLSWWSKVSIIERVLAPRMVAQERMGWLGLPANLSPVDENGNNLGDGWKVINRVLPPSLQGKDARIYAGDEIAKESSPLGVGHGRVLSNEFSMVTDRILDGLTSLDIGDMKLVLSKAQAASKEDEEAEAYDASIHFDVSDSSTSTEQRQTIKFPLKYAVRFVSGHPCRLPHGHTKQHSRSESDSASLHEHPKHRHKETLPSHPLHNSYKYQVISIPDLLQPDLTLPAGSPNVNPQPQSSSGLNSDKKSSKDVPTVPSVASDHDRTPASTAANAAQNIATEDPKETGTTSASAEALAWIDPILESASSVCIIDARGPNSDRDILVRSWCAMVGRDAIIARVGKCCLSCVIREAKALEIGVIIRVGEKL